MFLAMFLILFRPAFFCYYILFHEAFFSLLAFVPCRLIFVTTFVPIVVLNFVPTFVPRRLLFVPAFVPTAANQPANPASLVSSAMTSVVQVNYIFMDRARDCASQPASPPNRPGIEKWQQ